MSPKPEKSLFFDLLKLEDFVFFRNAHFLKNVVFLKPEHHFEGSSYPLCFLKNHEFSCFFKMLFFEGSGAHFFRFWPILEPPKSALTPPKWCSRLDESTILKKTWFVMKKRCSKKTWFFFVFGPSKITQNLKKNDFLAPPKPDFFILLSSRDPSDPPLAPSELKNPEKSPKNNTKQLKTPRNHQRCKLKTGHLQPAILTPPAVQIEKRSFAAAT